MKNKTMIWICCFLTACSLTGCRLALEDGGAGMNEDRMCGVLVTTEHLDLFDFESYLNDNISGSGFNGGEITVNGDTEKYQGRVYAEPTLKTLTSTVTGETYETTEYIFPDVPGESYLMAVIYEGGNRDVRASIADPVISGIHSHINVGDDSTSSAMEGTIYVTPGVAARPFYINPVYQSSDGRLYAVTGSGISGGERDSEGEMMSTTNDSTTTVTENGEEKTETVSIKLSVGVLFPPEKTVILQMDGESRLTERTEYAPDGVPQDIAFNSETHYVIVETHKRDASDEKIVSREIYGRDAEAIETFYTTENGICLKRQSQIRWE